MAKQRNYSRRQRIVKALVQTEPEWTEPSIAKSSDALRDFEEETSEHKTYITNPVDEEEIVLFEKDEEIENVE